MLVQKYETVKLFYDEYAYKIVILNSLSYFFRDKNFAFAKEQIDKLQTQYEKNEPLRISKFRKEVPVDLLTFTDAKNLYIEFIKARADYKLRIENPKMQIYSNNVGWLVKLIDRFPNVIEFWEPGKNNLGKLKANEIIVNSPPEYEYKVTLGDGVDPNLSRWISQNPDKAKAGTTCLETIANRGYVKGFYFYVRDEKVLNLISLFVGKVMRIDKLVYVTNSDK